jgi:hypothetical protein
LFILVKWLTNIYVTPPQSLTNTEPAYLLPVLIFGASRRFMATQIARLSPRCQREKTQPATSPYR